jgi:hypothetical protein
MESQKVLDYTHGRMVPIMKENLCKVSNTERVNGENT